MHSFTPGAAVKTVDQSRKERRKKSERNWWNECKANSEMKKRRMKRCTLHTLEEVCRRRTDRSYGRNAIKVMVNKLKTVPACSWWYGGKEVLLRWERNELRFTSILQTIIHLGLYLGLLMKQTNCVRKTFLLSYSPCVFHKKQHIMSITTCAG